MNKEDLKIWIRDNLFVKTGYQLNSSRLMYSDYYYKNIEYYEIIDSFTKFIDKDNILEKVYCIMNDVDSRPLCGCGKELSLISANKGYRKYCSQKCMNYSKRKPHKIRKKVSREVRYFNKRLRKYNFKFYDFNNKKDLKRWCQDNLVLNDKIEGQRLLTTWKYYNHNKAIFEMIEKEINFVESMFMRVYCIINDITEHPKCEICNENVVVPYCNTFFNKRCNNCIGKHTKEVIEKYTNTRLENNKTRLKHSLSLDNKYTNLAPDDLREFILSLKDINDKYSSMKIDLRNKFYIDNYKIFNQIINITKFLDDDAKMVERLYCIENNITEKVLCKGCNNNYIEFDSFVRYDKYCSYSCSATNRDNSNYRKLYYRKPTKLYYISIEKKGYPKVWKIGITINDVNIRFKDDIRTGCLITILNVEEFESGEYAYYKEQLIINSLSKYKYNGENILFGGNSELFIEDCYDFEKRN